MAQLLQARGAQIFVHRHIFEAVLAIGHRGTAVHRKAKIALSAKRKKKNKNDIIYEKLTVQTSTMLRYP